MRRNWKRRKLEEEEVGRVRSWKSKKLEEEVGRRRSWKRKNLEVTSGASGELE